MIRGSGPGRAGRASGDLDPGENPPDDHANETYPGGAGVVAAAGAENGQVPLPLVGAVERDLRAVAGCLTAGRSSPERS